MQACGPPLPSILKPQGIACLSEDLPFEDTSAPPSLPAENRQNPLPSVRFPSFAISRIPRPRSGSGNGMSSQCWSLMTTKLHRHFPCIMSKNYCCWRNNDLRCALRTRPYPSAMRTRIRQLSAATSAADILEPVADRGSVNTDSQPFQPNPTASSRPRAEGEVAACYRADPLANVQDPDSPGTQQKRDKFMLLILVILSPGCPESRFTHSRGPGIRARQLRGEGSAPPWFCPVGPRPNAHIAAAVAVPRSSRCQPIRTPATRPAERSHANPRPLDQRCGQCALAASGFLPKGNAHASGCAR